ncbi:MAG TPA: PspC domain-containing protein [Candidatus Faeciplasma avium]|uniref:PspC domain-containing protein n=1 Tax=Candidatus Faeciplasma avium TaxID=2840798 RepID=A0A9D1T3Y6_9FIRM|nr:PspC domain-containing protein [Candidatus Faeciplasma avium]
MSNQLKEKKLYKSRHDRKICGVCGGLAEYFGIDSTVVRLIAVVLLFTPIPTFIIYLIFAIVMPYNDNGTIVIDE